jgi:hypothetical protein
MTYQLTVEDVVSLRVIPFQHSEECFRRISKMSRNELVDACKDFIAAEEAMNLMHTKSVDQCKDALHRLCVEIQDYQDRLGWEVNRFPVK